jgi:hypothetical protein
MMLRKLPPRRAKRAAGSFLRWLCRRFSPLWRSRAPCIRLTSDPMMAECARSSFKGSNDPKLAPSSGECGSGIRSFVAFAAADRLCSRNTHSLPSPSILRGPPHIRGCPTHLRRSYTSPPRPPGPMLRLCSVQMEKFLRAARFRRGRQLKHFFRRLCRRTPESTALCTTDLRPRDQAPLTTNCTSNELRSSNQLPMKPSGVGRVFTAKRSNETPPTCLAEKLDRNLRWYFANSVLHFFSRVCETVRIDIDSDATIGTDHTLLCLQFSNGLTEIVPAVGANLISCRSTLVIKRCPFLPE